MNAAGALALPAHERLLAIDSSDRVRDGDRRGHDRTAAPRLEADVNRICTLGPHLHGRREGRGLVGDGAMGLGLGDPAVAFDSAPSASDAEAESEKE